MTFKASLVIFAVCVAATLLGCGGSSSSSTSPSAGPGNPGTPSSAPPSTTPGSGGSSGSGSGSGSSGSGSGSGGSGSGGTSSGGSGGGGSAQSASAYAYVGTTGSSTAGIFGFAGMPDGTATSVPGSPTSGPSSHVVTNSAFVFATDSSNIASYSRAADGSLTQTAVVNAAPNPGTPNAFLIESLNLDHTGQTLYALEDAGSDDRFYFFFSLVNGTVTKIGQIGPNAGFESPLVFSPDNANAYGVDCFHLDDIITGFRRNSDGSLTPFTTNGGTAAYAGTNQLYCPEAAAVSAMGYLAVADTVGGGTPTSSGVAINKINSDGTLTLVQSSAQQTALSQVNAMNFDPTGNFLALAGNGGIQMFHLMPGGGLTPIGVAQATGTNYTAVEWDNQNHVYATSSSGLSIFTNAAGTLTLAPGSPHAAGAAASLTVLPLH